MQFPRLPDWTIYGAVVLALVIASIGRRERADAPAPPPPVPGEEGVPLGPASPFDPAVVVEMQDKPQPSSGTAFSIADRGVWITARHVVEGCPAVAIVVAEGRGVATRVSIDMSGDAAVLTSEGGAPALPVLPAAEAASLRRGARAFHPGYPQGRAGEVTSRLLGRENLVVRGRGARTEPVLVWAEVGRTNTLKGTLSGLSGAPALDAAGRVIGVTVAEAPRRGRIYTTTPETLLAAMEAAQQPPSLSATGEAVNTENYGRVADALRRDLRVAQVVCLA
ncbi:MAG TPA: serine protease [Caulobacter sp.]|nr:serine protease [Caulobacter sp.]